ncbi:hypothetical protein [Pseudomonas cremoris]|uniref:hypothetical protein n=1 Tax=Pseudomonas cremoris TaxID=2724178 RepID=UPI00289E4847|nr:hypothetical protein [Pseudomonas cremoris]
MPKVLSFNHAGLAGWAYSGAGDAGKSLGTGMDGFWVTLVFAGNCLCANQQDLPAGLDAVFLVAGSGVCLVGP